MSKRSEDLMRLLKEELKIAFPSFIFAEGVSSGDPTLQMAADATPATTEKVSFLKVIQKAYSGFPIPSLASSEDGRPHLLQIVFEANAALATSTYFTGLELSQLMAIAHGMNIDIELYIRANGAIPVEGDIIAGNKEGDIVANVRHPNIGQ